MKNNVAIGLIISLLILASSFFTLKAQTIEGSWLTYDPRNEKPLSIVDIYVVEGQYYGRITKLYQWPPNDPNPICVKCSGDKKNQPWVGLVILEQFVPNGNQYQGGTLLIPKYGVSLPCTLVYDPQKPDSLEVVGRVGFITKSSTWTRINTD